MGDNPKDNIRYPKVRNNLLFLFRLFIMSIFFGGGCLQYDMQTNKLVLSQPPDVASLQVCEISRKGKKAAKSLLAIGYYLFLRKRNHCRTVNHSIKLPCNPILKVELHDVFQVEADGEAQGNQQLAAKVLHAGLLFAADGEEGDVGVVAFVELC